MGLAQKMSLQVQSQEKNRKDSIFRILSEKIGFKGHLNCKSSNHQLRGHLQFDHAMSLKSLRESFKWLKKTLAIQLWVDMAWK